MSTAASRRSRSAAAPSARSFRGESYPACPVAIKAPAPADSWPDWTDRDTWEPEPDAGCDPFANPAGRASFTTVRSTLADLPVATILPFDASKGGGS